METKPKFNLETDVPWIHNTIELGMWLRKSYVIEDYLVDDDTYNSFLKRIMNLIKGSFTIRECREYPVKFKFHQKDKRYFTLELRHFAINLILWNPFIELHGLDVLNGDFIIKPEEIPKIEDYINYKLIETLRDYNVKNTTINYRISDVLYNLRLISIDFSMLLGLNFSAMTFFDMYENNDEIRDIMEVTFSDDMQPHEIETKLAELQSREIEIYKAEKDNPIGVLLNANTGVKHKQFAEFTISEGLKPSLEGITIPKPIENSTLLRGLDRPSYLYIDATGSRKSLVMNKKVMGKAGYFGKIVLLLARTLRLSSTVYDCGSTHLVEYEIKTKKHLKKLSGKYFKENKDDLDLKLLKPKKYQNLVGKKIYVRSAVTCCLGDEVCHVCMGITSNTNADIADGISAFESEEVTKVINQSILSTKHLLTTNSEVIEFNSDFYKFFTILLGEINPIINDNEEIPNIEDFAIYINPEDIEKVEDQDYDSLYNTCISNGRFYIKNIANPDQEDIVIQAEGEKEIFVSEEATDLMKKNKKGLIYFKDMDDDTKLFEMVIYNKELTRPLYGLMNLLNKKAASEEDEDYQVMSQKFLDLLIESGIDANAIAAELIINRLIRSQAHPYERPDFSKEELEPYEIYRVSKALEKNRSPFIGLSFQDIKRQFLSDDLYTERNGTSFIDPFFWTDIPTDHLKEYRKLSDMGVED